MTSKNHDVIISGAGAVGMISALLLAKRGLNVAIIDPKPLDDIAKVDDTRNIALMQSSLNIMRYLNLFEGMEIHAKPLRQLRIIDASDRFLRAPEVVFDADELDIDYFALNIPIGQILKVLCDAVKHSENIKCYFENGIEMLDNSATILSAELIDGSCISAKLLVGADGRNSAARDFANIKTFSKSYPQMALGFAFKHDREIGDISVEFHRANGPFTLIPMKDLKNGFQTSLVWSESKDEAMRLKALSKDAIADKIFDISNGIVGKVTQIGKIAAFPLSHVRCDSLARNRIILAGEAAHILPPIGAQGMNLGIQDAAIIDEILGEVFKNDGDFGDEHVMKKYNQYRRADVKIRGKAVDVLNMSLLSNDIHTQFMRGMGLHFLKASKKLRIEVMNKALKPLGKTPKSMV